MKRREARYEPAVVREIFNHGDCLPESLARQCLAEVAAVEARRLEDSGLHGDLMGRGRLVFPAARP